MSFLNPLFLIGAAAVALPIIVHLVRRTKAPRIEFPSLMFVRRVPQRTIRRRRIQNLLLLALRCLAFLLLVLAFVRPYFSSSEAEAARGQRSSIILLDNSFSTRFSNRFDQAKRKALDIVNNASSGDRFAVVTFNQGVEIQSKLGADLNQIRTTINGLQPGSLATDYAQALRSAEALFKDGVKEEKRIYLISDFHKSGVNPAMESHRIGKSVKLIPVDTGEPVSRNLAVTDVGAQPLIYQAKYTDKLTARISNFSDEARQGARVELLLNDRTVEKREINIPAGESTQVEFSGFNLNPGANQAIIQVEGDNFPFDNRFFFILRRSEQSKALIIESATRGRGESFYLKNALTTGENLPFNTEVKTAGSINPNELAQYRLIILNDAGVISQALGAQLVKFAEAGGGLIISAGPHTDPAKLNEAFQNRLPAKLEEAVQLRGDYVSMSEIKTDHPIFEVFRRSGRLSAARVFGYHKSAPATNASVLARYEDANPALIESTLGSGRVLLFTSTFDSSWNDLPLTPIYLPFVRQMARYLGEREVNSWYLAGQSFTAKPAKTARCRLWIRLAARD
ncbi:MAG: BatA domain-containing protein [Acidobacteria bacterium]|nr:BatA domain-containing protein [Acidobacteriota bacterium]